MKENLERKFVWKDTDFWTEEIKKAGVFDQIRFFNDVIVDKKPPQGYGDEPVIKDVVLDGNICDIWHTDHKRNDTYHRIFIHQKVNN